MIRVLFICMGNICRSPAAEAVFQALIDQRGLAGHIETDSAGTLDFHAGAVPDPRSRAALARRGYSTHHRARQVAPDDAQRFDHLVVMDDINIRDLRRLLGPAVPAAKISRLLDWWPDAGRTDIPDPYYGTEDDFELMMDLIEGACPALLDAVIPRQPAGA